MRRTIAFLAACGLLLAPGALAQGKGRDGGPIAQLQDQGWGNKFSPGEARDGVKEGRLIPLNQIIQQLKRQHGGYLGSADLFSKDGGGAVYEIDWYTDDGRLLHLTVDAKTGSVASRRGG